MSYLAGFFNFSIQSGISHPELFITFAILIAKQNYTHQWYPISTKQDEGYFKGNKMFPHESQTPGVGGGGLPYKNDGGARRKS